MGIFGNFFDSIGSGLTKVYNATLKPAGEAIYGSVIKPVYTSVVKPVGESIGRIGSKALDTGEKFIEGGLDFTGKAVDKARDTALNVEDGVKNLSEFLKNPMVLIGLGIAGLVVVSKL